MRCKNKKIEIVISLLLFLVPTVMYTLKVPVTPLEMLIVGVEPQYVDSYNFMKSIILNFGMILMLILVMWDVLHKKINYHYDRLHLVFGFFLVLIVLSTLIGDYRSVFEEYYGAVIGAVEDITNGARIEFLGYYQRYEGLYAWVSYLVIAFVVSQYFKMVHGSNLISYAMIGAGFIVALIGVMDFAGYDMIVQKEFRWLFISPALLKQNMILIDTENVNDITSTLYNPNNLGQFMAMILPISITLLYREKDKVKRSILWTVQFMIFTCLVVSNASVAIMGISLISMVWLPLIYIRKLLNLKQILFLVSVWLLIFAGVNGLAGNFFFNELFVKNIEEIQEESDKDSEFDFSSRSIDDGVEFHFDDKVLRILRADGGYIFVDSDNKRMDSIIASDGNNYFTDKRYQGIYHDYDGGSRTIGLKYRKAKIFLYDYHEEFMIVGSNAMYYPIDYEVGNFDLPVSSRFGTYRGYIWERTIPLLMDRIFIGYGADTFPFVFPQYDYIGKVENYGMPHTFIDKPHNQYLNIWSSFGLIALLSVILLVAVVLLRNYRLLTNYDQNVNMIRIVEGYSVSIVIYLITSIAYDSMVVTSLYFWVTIGLLMTGKHVYSTQTLHLSDAEV